MQDQHTKKGREEIPPLLLVNRWRAQCPEACCGHSALLAGRHDNSIVVLWTLQGGVGKTSRPEHVTSKCAVETRSCSHYRLCKTKLRPIGVSVAPARGWGRRCRGPARSTLVLKVVPELCLSLFITQSAWVTNMRIGGQYVDL